MRDLHNEVNVTEGSPFSGAAVYRKTIRASSTQRGQVSTSFAVIYDSLSDWQARSLWDAARKVNA